MSGKIYAVGIGPGSISNMTARAVAVIGICDVVCGYDRYVELLGDMTAKKQVVTTGMRGEVKRCKKAIELAIAGHQVAVVCSGDAGVYGMAGLLYEMLDKKKDTLPSEGDSTQNGAGGYVQVEVEVVPGITAAISGASVLGAPLMNDFGVISLSDQLTPAETIERRLTLLAQSDMVIVLYNPMSHHRPDTLKKACDIILEYRDGDTVCGWVKNIGRDGQESELISLKELRDKKLDMLCTVYIGASDTRMMDKKMVTVRGYEV